MRTIYFDMDGTFVNFYGVENWLDMLINKDETPYRIAKPLFRMCDFARRLNTLQRNGYKIGIITWLAKNSDTKFSERITNAKMEWLEMHSPSVQFDEINILEYGIPKSNCATINDILFDDEKPNRDNFIGYAYGVENILEILRTF